MALGKRKQESRCRQLIEAAIFAAGKPLSIEKLRSTVLSEYELSAKDVKQLIGDVQLSYQGRGIELAKVASGYRFQTLPELGPSLSQLWTEKAPKYSRAMLETLSLIAYKQPITRAEIEEVRGVAVSTHIIRSLQERAWIKVVGHKDIPGRPALFSTSAAFLDYFGLESLEALPQIPELASTPFNLGNENPQFDSGESDVRKTTEGLS